MPIIPIFHANFLDDDFSVCKTYTMYTSGENDGQHSQNCQYPYQQDDGSDFCCLKKRPLQLLGLV